MEHPRMTDAQQALYALLESRHDRYNIPDFVPDDPIGIPHRFSRKEDIEIAGFFAALLAWGKRALIIRSTDRLMALMGEAPHDFVMAATAHDRATLDAFVHRTFNGADAGGLVLALRHAYTHAGGLEGIFSAGISPSDADVFGGIVHARGILLAAEGVHARTAKHLADPAAGSSAKRLNMYLRWMVRHDRRGVDFGLWTGIRPDQLLLPLDVHTGNVARSLGLLTRTQNDWRAVQELTAALRAFDPQDPVKYDFALFGMGVNGELVG